MAVRQKAVSVGIAVHRLIGQSHAIGTIVRVMLGRMAPAGIAAPDEMGVDTHDARLSSERQETNDTCVWERVLSAWARREA